MSSPANYFHHAVVAGVDGSAPSWAATQAAAWEAAQRGQDLALVHGLYEPAPYVAYGRSPHVPPVDAIEGAQLMLAETARKVREQHPDLAVHTEVLAGGGSSTLIQLSTVASLIVVGSRGHGGFGGLSIGSVAAQTAAHATCPVMVIRGVGHDGDAADAADAADAGNDVEVAVPKPGPVMVAIGGSPHDEAALGFAFEEASLRHVPLIGVHVWWFPPEVSLQPEDLDPYDTTAMASEADRVIAEAMAGWRAEHPDVPVEHRIIHALNPSYALIEESANAGLVVVGCRGRGGFAGLLLGSVSRDLVGHAQAPVAVIHDHT